MYITSKISSVFTQHSGLPQSFLSWCLWSSTVTPIPPHGYYRRYTSPSLLRWVTPPPGQLVLLLTVYVLFNLLPQPFHQAVLRGVVAQIPLDAHFRSRMTEGASSLWYCIQLAFCGQHVVKHPVPSTSVQTEKSQLFRHLLFCIDYSWLQHWSCWVW